MLKADKKNALHKSILLRVLINILDNRYLSKNLYFKGGTCASMLGYLDRFSVDLDFDLKDLSEKSNVIDQLENIFEELNLTIKDSSKNVVQYFLKYNAPDNLRNTIKIEAINTPFKNNKYEVALLPEINRYSICQTKDTLFSNKLVAPIDRYEKNKSIAARDIYDIHHFFQQGFDFNPDIIKERRGIDAKIYLTELITFIQNKITSTSINQDLNVVLDPIEFNSVRKTLKDETIALLNDAKERL